MAAPSGRCPFDGRRLGGERPSLFTPDDTWCQQTTIDDNWRSFVAHFVKTTKRPQDQVQTALFPHSCLSVGRGGLSIKDPGRDYTT